MGMGANKEQIGEKEGEPEPLPVGEQERVRIIKEVSDRLLYGICNGRMGTPGQHQWSFGDAYPLPSKEKRTDLCLKCPRWRSWVRNGEGEMELMEVGGW